MANRYAELGDEVEERESHQGKRVIYGPWGHRRRELRLRAQVR